jgi:hypothetical protein
MLRKQRGQLQRSDLGSCDAQEFNAGHVGDWERNKDLRGGVREALHKIGVL